MDQVLKRLYYGALETDVIEMRKMGYSVKQITGGGEYYVYVLFEKTEKTNDNLTV